MSCFNYNSKTTGKLRLFYKFVSNQERVSFISNLSHPSPQNNAPSPRSLCMSPTCWKYSTGLHFLPQQLSMTAPSHTQLWPISCQKCWKRNCVISRLHKYPRSWYILIGRTQPCIVFRENPTNILHFYVKYGSLSKWAFLFGLHLFNTLAGLVLVK